MQLSKLFSQEEKRSEVEFASNLKLAAEVVFGVSSQGCRGAGICKLTTLSNSEEHHKLMSPCKKAIVLISRSVKGNKLRFQFEKKSMCAKAIKNNFQFGYFDIQEDVEIPSAIRHKLEVYGKVISKGLYPVIETEDSFTVIF